MHLGTGKKQRTSSGPLLQNIQRIIIAKKKCSILQLLCQTSVDNSPLKGKAKTLRLSQADKSHPGEEARQNPLSKAECEGRRTMGSWLQDSPTTFWGRYTDLHLFTSCSMKFILNFIRRRMNQFVHPHKIDTIQYVSEELI